MVGSGLSDDLTRLDLGRRQEPSRVLCANLNRLRINHFLPRAHRLDWIDSVTVPVQWMSKGNAKLRQTLPRFSFCYIFQVFKGGGSAGGGPTGGGNPYPDVISHEENYQIVLVGGQRISDKLSSGI